MTLRARRLWIVAAALAVGLALAAATAVHVIVSTRLLRQWVNGDTESLLLDYDEASAWVPGTIRVRGLTLRGSDPNVQWRFRMDRAVISISLLDLLRKRFHATRVRAEGLVFRLREKKTRTELSPAHQALVPPVPGFPDPPLAQPEAETPPAAPASKSGYWTVVVDDLVADPVPDIWIEIYRFRGHARVTGSFFLHPHDRARVGPAQVDFLSGAFTLGPHETILSPAAGRADCRIDAYDPDEVRGQEIWRKISGNIRIEGGVEDLRFVNHFLRRTPEPRLAEGAGRARFAIRFDHGIGRGEGDYDSGALKIRYARRSLTGRASTRLTVPRWDVEHDDMEISGSRVDLAGIRTAGTPHDERDWWGRFDFVSGHLHGGLSAQTAVSCLDARPLYTLFGANLPGWAEGILKLQGMKGGAHIRLASNFVDVENLDAAGGKFHIAGRYRDRSDVRSGAFLIESGLLAVGVGIDGPTTHVRLLGARKWFEKAGASP
jgi:hypothetical protein